MERNTKRRLILLVYSHGVRRDDAVRTRVRGRIDTDPGRRERHFHADARASRPRTEPRGANPDATPRARGALRADHTLPRTTSTNRRMPRLERNRDRDLRRRRRHRPAISLRAG